MDVIEITSNLALDILLTVAVIQDFRQTKVSNRLILVGLFIAIVFRIFGDGIQAVVWALPNIIFPVIILYLFYLMRILGAGDIKLFSVVGGFLKFNELVSCMMCAFIVGAIISLIKMLYERTLSYRLFLGERYLRSILMGDFGPYSFKSKDSIMHFSLAILLGVIFLQLYSLWFA